VVFGSGLLHADDFYEQQLKLGTQAYRAGKFTQALDEFRIANFGFLDRPALLSEGLARLALAQMSAGRTTLLPETLNRFVDIEERFASYHTAKLEEPAKSAFEALLLKTVAAERLGAVPSLAGLAPSRTSQLAALPVRERRKALEAEARKNPSDPTWPLAIARDAFETKQWKDVEKFSSRVLDLDSANSEALTLRARGRMSRRDYAGATADFASVSATFWASHPEIVGDRFVALVEGGNLGDAAALQDRLSAETRALPDVDSALRKLHAAQKNSKPSDPEPAASTAQVTEPAPPPAIQAVEPEQPRSKGSFTSPNTDVLTESKRLINDGKASQAERMIYSAIKRDPNRRDLRLGFLEASSLASDWRSASAQIPLLEPFRSGEEPYMFYAAVVLFETGKEGPARDYLNRALPRLASSPMVDRYSKRILGTVQ